MEITIPAVKEEAERWAHENLGRFLIVAVGEGEGTIAKLSFDVRRFRKELALHMKAWEKDVKLVAREENND